VRDIACGAQRVLDIVPSSANAEPMVDQIFHLNGAINSLRSGVNYSGFMFSRNHIGTSAIVLHGGQRFDGSVILCNRGAGDAGQLLARLTVAFGAWNYLH
jgi:hypothetical protein